jgi:hypothetical protein
MSCLVLSCLALSCLFDASMLSNFCILVLFAEKMILFLPCSSTQPIANHHGRWFRLR